MANPKTAWRDAERIVFDRICSETKTSLGKGAMLGRLPQGLFNVWALNSGGGPGEQTQAGCFGSLRTYATIDARYKDRAAAQDFCSTVLNLLNITKNFNHIKNVQWFRLNSGGMPTVVDEVFTPSNQSGGRQVLAYSAHMDCELVYNTSTEYPAQ